MSVKFERFGAFAGNVDEDLRIKINAPGAKTPLLIIASWQRSPLAPIAGSVWGRLIVFEGAEFQGPTALSNGEFRPDSVINFPGDRMGGRVIFDVTVTDPGPHTFLPPLADLEGFRASQGSQLTIMQSVMISSDVDTVVPPHTGDHFRPFLNAAGQTITKGS